MAQSQDHEHDVTMARVQPLPARGDVIIDARGEGRSLRVSWHHEADLVVLSLWANETCTGTFRLRSADVPGLIQALSAGLADGYSMPPGRRLAS
jgi:hypothetical protein